MADDDQDPAFGHASWAVLQTLMIVLTERGRIEADDLIEALEEAADFLAQKGDETKSVMHRRAALRLQALVRDITAADSKR